MSNSVTKLDKTHDKEITSEIPKQSPLPSEELMIFQLFFLGYDQRKSVEVVETEELDFGEIVQRLSMGESVFIKNKNENNIESARACIRVWFNTLLKAQKVNSWIHS